MGPNHPKIQRKWAPPGPRPEGESHLQTLHLQGAGRPPHPLPARLSIGGLQDQGQWPAHCTLPIFLKFPSLGFAQVMYLCLINMLQTSCSPIL